MTESSAATTSSGQVDSGGAGEHVLDEAFVTRHVDDAEVEVAEVQRGEADVDRDAAGFFLGQAGRNRCR